MEVWLIVLSILLGITVSLGLLYYFSPKFNQWINNSWKKIAVIGAAGVIIGSGVIMVMDEPPSSSVGSLATLGAEVDYASGTIAWSEEDHVAISNNEYTTSVVTGGAVSEYLKAYHFNFAIPPAVINGITVTIDRKASVAGSIYDNVVYLSKDGTTVIGTSQNGGTAWPTTEASKTYPINSSTTYKWGTTWTVAKINSDSFGVFLAVNNLNEDATVTASVDCITITVYYTISQPDITINFAGNHNEKGGPYWLSPHDITRLSDSNYNGYYTNNSMQSESWIYINTTVIDTATVTSLKLHWHNETTNQWYNQSGFVHKAGNYWEINTSVNITNISAGHKYTFDIYGIDDVLGTTTIGWNKTGPHDVEMRRYVYLKCTPETVTYRPLYLWNLTGYTYPLDLTHDVDAEDKLTHDQGMNGGFYDTGSYLFTTPTTGNWQSTNCGVFTGGWFDETVCPTPFTLTNIYYHIWWNTASPDVGSSSHRMMYAYNRSSFGDIANEPSMGNGTIYPVNITTSKSNLTINHNWPNTFEDFHLFCKLNTTTDTFAVTDNNIYEIMPVIWFTDAYPMLISNRSFTSFVLFNVPTNATLGSTDTDSDGLTDVQELYTYFTNPFLADTDNDTSDDLQETEDGTDPNDYNDFILRYDATVRNSGVDYFIWLGANGTASTTIVPTLTGFDEGTEYIAQWNTSTAWGSDGIWTKWYGDNATGINFYVKTFDAIKIYLTDSGTSQIIMVANTNLDDGYYGDARSVSLTIGINQGANYVGWTDNAATTASALATAITLDANEQVWWWNEATYTWEYYVVGFWEPAITISEDDVLMIRVENLETMSIGGK